MVGQSEKSRQARTPMRTLVLMVAMASWAVSACLYVYKEAGSGCSGGARSQSGMPLGHPATSP